MIIVSQDKTMIFNFENIETIGLGNPLENNEGRFPILVETVSDNQYPIAEYGTEDRAKEVLQEIIMAYVIMKKAEDGNSFLGGFQFMQKDTLYEMPEK